MRVWSRAAIQPRERGNRHRAFELRAQRANPTIIPRGGCFKSLESYKTWSFCSQTVRLQMGPKHLRAKRRVRIDQRGLEKETKTLRSK